MLKIFFFLRINSFEVHFELQLTVINCFQLSQIQWTFSISYSKLKRMFWYIFSFLCSLVWLLLGFCDNPFLMFKINLYKTENAKKKIHKIFNWNQTTLRRTLTVLWNLSLASLYDELKFGWIRINKKKSCNLLKSLHFLNTLYIHTHKYSLWFTHTYTHKNTDTHIYEYSRKRAHTHTHTRTLFSICFPFKRVRV